MHLAWERIFNGRGYAQMLDCLRRLFPAEDFDDWGFSPLHEIILGLSHLLLPGLSRLGRNLDVNCRDAFGMTPLCWASSRGDVESMELLLDAGADVEAADSRGMTPLFFAVNAYAPQLRPLELLLLRGANPNHVDPNGYTALHFAAVNGTPLELVKALINAGADIDGGSRFNGTPLLLTAGANCVEIGEFLLQRGADRYQANKWGRTPLVSAVLENSAEFLDMLLEHGTAYERIDQGGRSILHYVAVSQHVEIARVLIAHGITGLDTELKNCNGFTAMDLFWMHGTDTDEDFKEAFFQLMSMLDPNWSTPEGSIVEEDDSETDEE